MIDDATPDRRAIVILLMLIAGAVDAIGLAETGRYFVSFMSGNLTMIGVAAGTRGMALAALLPLGLVALFVAGATIGALVAERAGVAGGAALLLLIEAALLLLGAAGLGTARPMLGVVPLPVAMGLANIVNRRAGATYATGSLVAFGAALAGLGQGVAARTVLFRGALCAALIGGAVLGTIGRLRWGGAVLLVPAAVLALVALVEYASAMRAKKAAAPGR